MSSLVSFDCKIDFSTLKKMTMKRVFQLVLMCTITMQLSAQDVWTKMNDMPFCTSDGVTFGIGKFIYYVSGIPCDATSGFDETQEVWALEVSSDTWTQLGDFAGRSRRLGCAFTLNNKGYVGLGYDNGVPLTDLWEYDPNTDTWTQVANFIGTARGAVMTATYNDEAYVGFGFGPGSADWYPMDIVKYNAQEDEWTHVTTMPGIARYDSEAFILQDTLYVVGGTGGELLLPRNDFWAYSLQGDTWSEKNPIPSSSRWYSSSFVFNDAAYYGFGLDQPNYYNDFMRYTPDSGEWEYVSSPAGPGRLFDGVAVLSHGVFAHGGVRNGQLSAEVWQFNTDFASDEHVEYDPKEWSVSPNPAHEQIQLTVPLEGNYALIDMTGRTIKQLNLQEGAFSFSIQDLSAGLYAIVSLNHNLPMLKIMLE